MEFPCCLSVNIVLFFFVFVLVFVEQENNNKLIFHYVMAYRTRKHSENGRKVEELNNNDE